MGMSRPACWSSSSVSVTSDPQPLREALTGDVHQQDDHDDRDARRQGLPRVSVEQGRLPLRHHHAPLSGGRLDAETDVGDG